MVVTMLQKRNQVERVFCADVQRALIAAAATATAPVQVPRWNLEGLCFHAASVARGAHRARRHAHAHAHVHVGSPWSADQHVCLDMLCGIPFVFGILL